MNRLSVPVHAALIAVAIALAACGGDNATRPQYNEENWAPVPMLKMTIGGAQPGAYGNPADVAVGRPGTIYVSESAGLIQRFSSDGRVETPWRISGDRMTVDPDGRVFIRRSSSSVARLDAAGNVVQEWGASGRGDGQFQTITDLAAGPDGHIFVADRSLKRIQEFLPDGTFVRKFGRQGIDDGEMENVLGLEVDHRGFVYVLDDNSKRIVRFGPGGAVAASWALPPTPPGTYAPPTALTVEDDGIIDVAQYNDDPILRFSPDGEPLPALDVKGLVEASGLGHLDVERMAAGPGGGIVVMTRYRDRVLRISREGRLLGFVGHQYGTVAGELYRPANIGIDFGGNIYLLARGRTGYDRVEKYSPDGLFLKFWEFKPLPGEEPVEPMAMAVTPDGRPWVIDGRTSELIELDEMGNKARRVALPLSEDSNSFYLRVRVGPDGGIYVAEMDQRVVHHVTPGGLVDRSFPLTDPSGSVALDPEGLMIRPDGEIWVSGTLAATNPYIGAIERFAPDGSWLGLRELPSSGPGLMVHPTSMACDGQENTYVVDDYSNRVVKFGPNLGFLTRVIGRSVGVGEFGSNLEVATDASDNLYILDAVHDRVMKFGY